MLITKIAPGAGSDFVMLDRELTREVAAILRQKVKKIDLVDPERVWAWDHAHPTWSDPAELAEAFDADIAVFLEINGFQIQDPSSPGMLEGHSGVHVRVVERAYPTDDRGRPMTDRPKQSRIVHDGDRETNFPSRGPIPASADVTPVAFKNRFLKLVALEISWEFVGHAPGDEIQEVRF